MSGPRVYTHIRQVPGLPGESADSTRMAQIESDVANLADGLTHVAPGSGDRASSIQGALTAGGKVLLQPGNVYEIGSTLTISTPLTDLDGVIPGTLTTGSVTLRARSGFSGPLIRINISDGSKGAWVRNLRLDGNGQAGVTAGIEYADGTISTADLADVTIVNCPIGIKTGENQQSYRWDRVYAFESVGIGADIGARARHIMIRDSRIGGTSWAARVGADTATTSQTTQTVIFDGCELYGRSGSSGAVLVRKSQDTRLLNCYIEAEGTMDSLVQLGTATANAMRPLLTGNRYGGNAMAQHGVRFVNTTYPTLIGKGSDNLPDTDVGNDDTDSFGIVLGMSVDNVTGLLLALGADTLTEPQYKTALRVGRAAGWNLFEAYIDGESYARYALRNNGGLRMGSGTSDQDTIILRYGANVAGMGQGDSFAMDGTWNGGHLQLGDYHLWVDATGDLRISNGGPASDTAGVVVGSQS